MSKDTRKAYVAPKLEERGAFAARTLQYVKVVITAEDQNPDLEEFPGNI